MLRDRRIRRRASLTAIWPAPNSISYNQLCSSRLLTLHRYHLPFTRASMEEAELGVTIVWSNPNPPPKTMVSFRRLADEFPKESYKIVSQDLAKTFGIIHLKEF